MAVPQECPVGSLPSPSCSPWEDHQFPGVWFAGSLGLGIQNLNDRLMPTPLLSLLAIEVGPYWIPTMLVIKTGLGESRHFIKKLLHQIHRK